MKRVLEKKARSFGALGQATVDLAKAEGAALSSDLKGSGRILTRSLALIALGLFSVFWAFGALAFLGVELLAAHLPRWGAVLVVFAFFLLLAVALAGVGWLRIKRLEGPAATVRRHWEGYRDWWSRRWVEARGSGASPGDEPS